MSGLSEVKKIDIWRGNALRRSGCQGLVKQPVGDRVELGRSRVLAALKGASQALGFKAMLEDLGITAKIILYTDSSAARGIIHRAGLGKLRHLETGYLWLQAAVKAKRLQVRKVLGAENPADLFTKHLAMADMWKHLGTLMISEEAGGSRAVPAI